MATRQNARSGKSKTSRPHDAASRKDSSPKDSSNKNSSGKDPATEREVEDIEERSTPRTPVIYEIVRRHGEEEMRRPAMSLMWSGIAAGMSISFSVLAQAILITHLPKAEWTPLITSFGYSVGFLMVVLSRQQLFTENTITVVLPVMAKPTLGNILGLTRMWSIVLCANIAGTLFAALFCSFTPVISPELREAMLELGRPLLHYGWFEMGFKGIAAGFLVAAMVWLIPGANAAQFHIITLMTWLIAVGEFTHIIAGSVEAFLLVINGDWSVLAMIGHFMVPTLLGNVFGGTALFALISYAQVMREI